MMALEGKAIIKEEIPDKEIYEQSSASGNNNNNNNNRRLKSGNGGKDNCRNSPDSPESARAIAPRSPMSPQIHHTSSTLVPQAPPSTGQQQPQRPNRNNSSSPVINGATTTPPPSSSQQPTQTATTLISTANALTAATLSHLEQTRALCKIRKFLGSLVQLGQESHPEASDRIRALVISLASGGITIDEFRIALYDVTNIPFKSYVIPFLKSHIPLLQREVAALARANNQTTLLYITQNDSVAMEFSHNSNDHPDIFIETSTPASNLNPVAVAAAAAVINGNGIPSGGLLFKRRPSDSVIDHHNQDWNDYMYPPPNKRHLTGHGAPSHLGTNLFNNSQSSSLFEYQSSGSNNGNNQTEAFGTLLDKSLHREEREIRGAGPADRSNSSNANRMMGGEEEWKNIYTMLNCISAMVEKTKRAITILQQRGQDPQQPGSQNTNYSESNSVVEIRRQTEEKVAEFKRNAEEAVNQVKRQAVIEIQRAVAAAENRAADVMAQERLKMEKFFVDMCRHNAVGSDRDIENKTPPISSSQTACWNCGRKANETCSGCNMARYCGAFCQHKDWEHHHQICGNARSDAVSAANKHPSLVVAAAAAAAAVARGQLTRSPPTQSASQNSTSLQQPRSNDSQSNTNALIPNGVNSGGGTK